MTFRHLECAVTVAHAGSINKAAKKMLVSQPYLSGMIKSLEQELGYPLFIRSNQGVRCTDEGERFISHAESIAAELASIKAIARDREAPLTVATYYSRFITEQFLAFHNGSGGTLGDKYREMGNMEVLDGVARRDYGLGIIYHARSKRKKFMGLADRSSLAYHTLFDAMGTYLVMSPKHPLARKEHIGHDELAACDMVFFDDASTVLYMVEHLKLPESATDFSVSDRGTFIDALNSGRYLSVINTPFPEKERDFVLKDVADSLPADADFEVGSAYLHRKDHRLTKRERGFLAAVMRGRP